MSALDRFSASGQTSPEVRVVPKTDSCTAANGVRVAGSSHEDGGAIVGNAFTGAVDDAISEGFSEGRGHKFES
jgi:hypothetical protein